ncbi:hypothetical protein KAFR_0A06000 [Kazachstania africana CBS 2517]|uniref:C2H2-type domain-containing protein n=1 Tax=Kazachstania africana (strain ATCC 22294 / BCRC 22015 / CBS 2517 / CECT 1963 / NBRC 1671 / NRRL Y-8276) TaxID=1071382 RepID=H2ANT5_KAZAF|nr:hypothetical protein KAFR_0A06000 [Kazachstania africana CBS 2517]CCF56035.1 hypothetical protein KAFR_0A06000 [Kazachstania africana CBS 2517]
MSSVIFTCNSCNIQFKSSDQQRYHMKTDWHRYNLKRRVAELSPISADEFAKKLQISEREQAENQVDEFGFAILKPLSNKKHSKKHNGLPNLRGIVSDTDSIVTDDEFQLVRTISAAESTGSQVSVKTNETRDTNTDFGEDTASDYGFTSDSTYTSDLEVNVPSEEEGDGYFDPSCKLTQCIYCGLDNKEIERNVKHMFHNHGLYIPERTYLVDLEALLKFLIQRIVVDHGCLCCGFEGSSLESIRAHMHSKRHCKMPYETKEEREQFAPFYDFSSLEEPEGKPKAGKGGKKIQFDVPHEYNEETVSVDDTGLELTLPSGARIGHRSGQRYYRQNLPSPPEESENRSAVTSADRRLVSGITEKQYKKGMKKMQQLEKRAIDDKFRKESKRLNFQAHYRDELLQ